MCTVPTHGGGTRSPCALPPGPPWDCGSWPRSRSSPETCAPVTQQRPTGFCCLRPSPCPGVPWTQLSRDWPLLCRLRGPGVYTAEGRPESLLTLWAAAVPPAAEQGPVQGWGRLGRPGCHGRSRGHNGAGHRACSVGGWAGSQSQGPWKRELSRMSECQSSHCWCRTEATKRGMHLVSVVPSQASGPWRCREGVSMGGCSARGSSLRRLRCPSALLVRNSPCCSSAQHLSLLSDLELIPQSVWQGSAGCLGASRAPPWQSAAPAGSASSAASLAVPCGS